MTQNRKHWLNTTARTSAEATEAEVEASLHCVVKHADVRLKVPAPISTHAWVSTMLVRKWQLEFTSKVKAPFCCHLKVLRSKCECPLDRELRLPREIPTVPKY